MEEGNLAAVLYKPGDLRLEDYPVREPGPGEVLVSMKSVGICGTDIELWQHGSAGGFGKEMPMVLGHEASGVIAKLGPNVTNVQVGDRVALMGGDPCKKCELCYEGKVQLCSEYARNFPWDYLARYAIQTQAEQCFKLSESVSYDEGAVAEPLAVVVRACRRADIQLGNNVLVCGAGTIGLLSMLVAKLMGAAEVTVTDVNQSRLDMATKLGANHTLLVPSDSCQATKLITQTLGYRPDRTIECSAAQSSLQTAILATKSGGVVLLVGLANQDFTLPIVDAATREVDIRGSLGYANNDFGRAVMLLNSGQLDVKPIITHVFPLEETLKAYNIVKQQQDGAVKVIIRCNKS